MRTKHNQYPKTLNTSEHNEHQQHYMCYLLWFLSVFWFREIVFPLRLTMFFVLVVGTVSFLSVLWCLLVCVCCINQMKEEHEQRTNNKDNAKAQKHSRNIKTPNPRINHQRKTQSITQNTTQTHNEQ